jgi:hypothetical protein
MSRVKRPRRAKGDRPTNVYGTLRDLRENEPSSRKVLMVGIPKTDYPCVLFVATGRTETAVCDAAEYLGASPSTFQLDVADQLNQAMAHCVLAKAIDNYREWDVKAELARLFEMQSQSFLKKG